MTRLDDVRARHAARLRTRAAKGDGETQMSTLVDDDVAWLLGEVERLKGLPRGCPTDSDMCDTEILMGTQRVEALEAEVERLRTWIRKGPELRRTWAAEERAERALEYAADEANRRREKYLESPSLSMDWVAGWHAAVDDVTATLRALAPVAPDAEHAEPKHIGGRANAEDCPACAALDLPYPWICPGDPEADPC